MSPECFRQSRDLESVVSRSIDALARTGSGRERVSPDQSSSLLSLPFEIRSMIWSYALRPRKRALVSPLARRTIHRLRHDMNAPRVDKRNRRRHDSRDTQNLTDTNWLWTSWHGSTVAVENAQLLKPQNLLSLALTARTVCCEVCELFYGNTHFYFENKIAMHSFLDVIGENARFLKCMSLCLMGNHGFRSKEVATGRRVLPSPSLAMIVERIQEDCPIIRSSCLELVPPAPKLMFRFTSLEPTRSTNCTTKSLVEASMQLKLEGRLEHSLQISCYGDGDLDLHN